MCTLLICTIYTKPVIMHSVDCLSRASLWMIWRGRVLKKYSMIPHAWVPDSNGMCLPTVMWHHCQWRTSAFQNQNMERNLEQRSKEMRIVVWQMMSRSYWRLLDSIVQTVDYFIFGSLLQLAQRKGWANSYGQAGTGAGYLQARFSRACWMWCTSGCRSSECILSGASIAIHVSTKYLYICYCWSLHWINH